MVISYMSVLKCSFMSDRIVFLGYVISAGGMHMDNEKVKTILDWPISRNFSSIVAPMLNVLKKDFQWTTGAEKSLQ